MENKHKELGIFYTLMENTKFKNILVKYGENTRLITRLVIVDAELRISYTNVKTTYQIHYEGVLITEKEIEGEDTIHKDLLRILYKMKQDVINEFLSYE